MRGRIGLLAHEPLLYRELSAAREPALPRPPARGRGRAGGGAAGCASLSERGAGSRCGRSRAGWSSGWRSRGRCCTNPSCCCSTSPTRTSTRRRSSWSGPLIGPESRAHAGALQPRPGRRRWRRPTWCSGCAPAAGAAGTGGLGLGGGARGAVPVSAHREATSPRGPRPTSRSPPAAAWRARRDAPGADAVVPAVRLWSAVGALLRKELLVELRTLESVPGMSLFAVTTFVVFHFALNRASVEGDLAAGRAVGDAAVRRDARGQPPVRGRRRGGRLRRLPAGARRPHARC